MVLNEIFRDGHKSAMNLSQTSSEVFRLVGFNLVGQHLRLPYYSGMVLQSLPDMGETETVGLHCGKIYRQCPVICHGCYGSQIHHWGYTRSPG
jgi:hypothetical protein